ncbi:hypothetical protein C7271_25250, partial [filamentous cyanobacterium CCP5]
MRRVAGVYPAFEEAEPPIGIPMLSIGTRYRLCLLCSRAIARPLQPKTRALLENTCPLIEFARAIIEFIKAIIEFASRSI